MNEDGGFLSRWSRRKAQVRDGQALPAEPAAAAPELVPEPPALPQAPITAEPEVPPPTLEEAQALTPASDFTRFVARDVDPSVKNAALKQLFADPQFNVMDGLDTYIDDYGRPDPIPEGMLRQLVQSQVLGLFRDAEAAPAAAAPAVPAPPKELSDEDAAVRLQPDDAAGRGTARAPEPGAGEDPGRIG